MTKEIKKIPVAIVGGGPVGLMLALFLDHYGVKSVLFNGEPEVRWHPKGSTHNSRTMEHHRRLGLAQTIRDFSLPADRPMNVSYYTRLTGWDLGCVRMPSEADKRRAVAQSAATDQIPEPILRANQMYVEAFLLAEARRRPNITVRFGWQADKLDDDADGVTVEAVPTGDGARETWRAQYLVGCDGGRSFVRRFLALRYHGLAKLDSPHYGGRMNATYLKAPTLYRDHLAHRAGWQYWTVNRRCARPSSRSERRRIPDFLQGRRRRRAADRRGDGPHDATRRRDRASVSIIGHWPWTAGVALVAERFIAGRIILAGDAAHLFTPTGGFGMNTGVDDASNLAWKLAALVQGWGGANLLQTYETERRPIGERNTVAARELNKNLANMPITAEMEQDTTAGAAARAQVSAHLATFGEEFASIGVQLGARYDGSPIVAEDGAPPPDALDTYTPSGVPGGRAPHYWPGTGRGYGDSLFDRLGVGFTLLRLGGKPADTSSIEAAARQRRVPLKVIDLPQDDARELYGRDLALIRPDQYVAWRGDAPPADPDRMLARLVGA